MRAFHVGLGIFVLVFYFLFITNIGDVLPNLQEGIAFGAGGRRGRSGLGMLLGLPVLAAVLFIFGHLIDDTHMPHKLRWLAHPRVTPDIFYVIGYVLLIFSVVGFTSFHEVPVESLPSR